jgi:SAM-dependent methyltransferase
MPLEDRVVAHYGQDGLLERILGALRAAGIDPDRPAPEDLAPIDEFHVRGQAATADLGRALGLRPVDRVLDIGCGIGGPSRHMALAHGCHVTGIDLTEAYCRVATDLAARLGLAERVAYRQASALALPFSDGSFDATYTQHVAMNIEDKPRLYAEAARVLRPGTGRFGLYDLLQGPGGEVTYPVPWARDPGTSFLVTPDALRVLLEAAGFEIMSWRDTSAEARAWRAALQAQPRPGPGAPPPLSVAVLFGEDFPLAMRSLGRNIEEGRVLPTEVICRRRSNRGGPAAADARPDA